MGDEVIVLSDREAWLKARRDGIGASDAAAVLGESPFASPFAVYCDKLGLSEQIAETEQMLWGRLLEPVVADRYQAETGRQLVDPGRFTLRTSASRPFMLATLDREILGDARGPGVLEIKTTNQFRGDNWADEPPVQYQIQVQHQLAVTGYAWGSLAVLIGGQRFLWCDVERNDRFIALMIEREAEFWDRVLRQDAPDPAATKADRALLAALYPQDTGEVIDLPGEALGWDAQRIEAAEQIKHWESVRDAAENLLKAQIGAASVGVLSNGIKYTWRSSDRKGYTVAPTTVRTLRRSMK